MAYITSETVKEFRNQIKAAFPASKGWKWSVTKEHHSSVTCALMQFPAGYDFAIKREGNDTSNPLYTQLNHYYLENSSLGKKEIAVLNKVKDILFSKHWDKSDIMTDYFNCAYYVNMHIGKWDKPAVQAAPKKPASTPRKARNATNENNPTMTTAQAESIAAFIGIQF